MQNEKSFIARKATRKVRVGDRFIGGDSEITIQSMTNTDTRDALATIEQIKRLEEAGCDIVRIAVPDMEAAEAVREIKPKVKVPLVADIHFDYRLAIACIENGVDKIRINPGNIGDREKVKIVVEAARSRDIPIRIGVNSGSIEKEILAKYGRPTAEGMAESALGHAAILEELGYNDIVISLKSSDVMMTVQACRIISQKTDYPLHLGVTESGTYYTGTVKSAIGIGTLLAEGIGDTMRVSLTGDPVEEVKAGKEILKVLGYRKEGIDLISCPTCGRCQVDLVRIANEVEKRLPASETRLKVAIMGCAVNGPGEAREADIGIAGGKGEVLLFRKGEIIRKIPQEKAADELIEEIRKLL